MLTLVGKRVGRVEVRVSKNKPRDRSNLVREEKLNSFHVAARIDDPAVIQLSDVIELPIEGERLCL